MKICALLDHLKKLLNLKNDAALSRALNVDPPVISKLRHDRLPLGASMIIKMHEVSGMTIASIKKMVLS